MKVSSFDGFVFRRFRLLCWFRFLCGFRLSTVLSWRFHPLAVSSFCCLCLRGLGCRSLVDGCAYPASFPIDSFVLDEVLTWRHFLCSYVLLFFFPITVMLGCYYVIVARIFETAKLCVGGSRSRSFSPAASLELSQMAPGNPNPKVTYLGTMVPAKKLQHSLLFCVPLIICVPGILVFWVFILVMVLDVLFSIAVLYLSLIHI